MIVYSKKIIQFVIEIKTSLKTLLTKEVRLKVTGDRFYNQQQTTSYPIKVVIYNNKSSLGYFDPYFYEIGFHECLMHSSKNQLHNIIRHELAHYITYINHGETLEPHGTEFRAICKHMGWGEEVYKATFLLDGSQSTSSVEETSIFRKVQKLMALANSSNQHEAEQAMIKSQQLLLKHNIESTYMGAEDEEKVCLKRIMKQSKENTKMRSIATILETFMVSTVYNRAKDGIYLEILGSAVNVEIAEYVAAVLQDELDKLWAQAQERANLRGTIAKNSFFMGLAIGYCNKIEALKREYTNDAANALMVIEKKLVDAQAMVYQRLRSTKSQRSLCSESAQLGEQMGKALNINLAIQGSSKNSEEVLFLH